ncbi:MAG: TatD family hydrolase [Clostridia bacterium]|nr:TatD family hydrolase [Clostridia bacterium]
MLMDTHAHMCDEAFDVDRDEVIRGLGQRGVAKVIEIACDPAGFDKAVELADRHDNIYLAFGIHPEYASQWADKDIAFLREYLRHPRCVALGEIGLDYYWEPYDKAAQIKLFCRQLDMAAELSLPVSLHVREGYGDAVEILSGYPGTRGVMHCFSGSAEMAERCVKLGLYVAFGGAVTFKNNKKGPAAAAAVPLDRLLVETDCPYMAPEPHRGKRCDPAMTRLVCEKLAAIKGVSVPELERITGENAARLFGI